MANVCSVRLPADVGCLTVCLLFLWSGSVPRTAQATIIGHNGTTSSTPPGTGEVNVVVTDLGSTSTLLDADQGFCCDIDYTDPTWQHSLTVAGDSGQLHSIDKKFSNQTSVPWLGIVLTLDEGDFWTVGSPPVAAPEVDPVGTGLIELTPITGSVTVDHSTIVRAGAITTLRIFFDDPVDLGDKFRFLANVDHSGTFTLIEKPIPEPSSMFLAAIGWLGLVRRAQK